MCRLARSLAIALAVRFVPAPVLAECRTKAQGRIAARPLRWWVLPAVWVALAAAGLALYL